MTQLTLPRLAEVATGLTLAATAAAALSVVYDYGFATGLNLSFGHIPSTLADVSQGALLWLPPMLVLLLVFVVAFRRALTAPAPRIKPRSKRQNRIISFVGFCVTTLLLSWLAFYLIGSAWWSVLLGTASGFWMSNVGRRTKVETAPELAARLASRYLVPLIASVFLLGYFSGPARAQTSTAVVTLAASSQVTRARLIRVYERGVLCVQDDRAVFYPWDAVQLPRERTSPPVTRGFCPVRRMVFAVVGHADMNYCPSCPGVLSGLSFSISAVEGIKSVPSSTNHPRSRPRFRARP